MAHEKFSNWMKVDLHIHSDWSKKTKVNDYQGNFSIENLKQKLKDNDVSIFSLTDHNIINLPAYQAFYQSYNPVEDPLLLLGVELDIIVENGNSNTYHSLLIFNYTDYVNAQIIHDKLEKKYKEKNIDIFQRQLTIGEIVELFPEDDFFFIPHAGNTKSILSSYKGQIDNAQKMVLLMQSAFEKVPEKNIQRYNDGFDKNIIEAFRNKDDNAYIQFSDNHNANKYPCTGKDGDDHEFYYLKGSRSFETLRLAFIDPKSRIKSSLQYLELSNQTNYIEKIKIEGDSILDDCILTFSPHLNVLIGGRSSGKSLMMSILGEKINGIEATNSVYKIDNSKSRIKSKIDSDFQTETAIRKEEIIYIKQNEIVRFFEKKNLEELAKSSDKLEKYNFEKRKFSEHKKNIENKIEEVLQEYNSFGNSDLTKMFVLHSANIENILNSEYVLIFDYNSLKLTHNWSENIIECDETIENITAYIEEFKNDLFFDWSADELIAVSQFVAIIDTKKRLIEKKKLIQKRKFYFLDEINKLIIDQNSQLNKNAKQKAESIGILSKLKEEVGERFNKLKKLKKSTDSLEKFDYSLEHELDITADVKLIMEVECNSTLKDIILEGVKDSNSNQSLYMNLLGLLRGTKSIKNTSDNTTDTLRQKIKRLLKEVNNSLENPRDYLKYKDGGTSKRNSPGFNSEKYLEIILNNPNSKFVFVDQPEDNLGNKFIAETLVNILRKIKFRKQIFLVTHNPSVVVYGDAENVIIANNDGTKISYSQYVLEDTSAQKEICNILDGGEYIFDMRSKKYNIQKLLKGENNE